MVLMWYYLNINKKGANEMEKENRTFGFNIKATKSEKETIKENARNAGLPVATYIRMVALKGGK